MFRASEVGKGIYRLHEKKIAGCLSEPRFFASAVVRKGYSLALCILEIFKALQLSL